MPKNRVIPFGYCMKNGEITTEPKEVYAVAEIFREYLNARKGKAVNNCKAYGVREHSIYRGF